MSKESDTQDNSKYAYAYAYMLRQIARKRIIEAINQRCLRDGMISTWGGTTVCSIDGKDAGDAFEYSGEIWASNTANAAVNKFGATWKDIYRKNVINPYLFDVAIWQQIGDNQVLVALAIGYPSNNRGHLTLKWIDINKNNNNIGGRAIWVILGCAEEYAKLLGCDKVLINEPVDPDIFNEYGYVRFRHPNVPNGGNYLGKEL